VALLAVLDSRARRRTRAPDRGREPPPGAHSIDINLAGLERLDTFGAWLIERLTRSFAKVRLGFAGQ